MAERVGPLRAQRLSVEAVRKLRPLAERIQRLDRNLADQLRRAASSISLNLAERAYNGARHRRAIRVCLRLQQ